MEPHEILRILRKRGWKVVCWTIALGVLVGAASNYFQKPVYQTGAQVVLQPNNSAQAAASQSQSALDLPTYTASQLTIAHSIAVAQDASKAMPGHPDPGVLLGEVSVVPNPTSGVLTFVAKSGDRAEAQAAANAFAKAYVATSYTYALGNLKTAVADIQSQLDRMLAQLDNLDVQIAKASSSKGKGGTVSPASLKTKRQVVWVHYNTLLNAQEGLSTSAQLTTQQAVLVAPAGLPGTPVSPKPLRDAALGATAGLLIGLGIELLREKFDDKVNTAEEIEAITASPLLAQIPKDERATTASPVVIRPGEFSEAVRALRTGLQFLGVDRPLRRIVVSSAGTGDGKTTVAAHLAVAYAEAGFVTVLVSGDLRRPQAESLFGSTNSGLGLSSLLATGPLRPRSVIDLSVADLEHLASNGNGHTNGNGYTNGNGNGNGYGSPAPESDSASERTARLTEFLRLLALPTGIDNLSVIPAGPTPPNPAELLGSTRMREALDALGEHADVIIIDTPPALVVTDSVVLADAADGVVLVMSAAKSTSRDLRRLMAVYRTAGVPVLGAVLNRARSRGKNEYYSAYKTPTPQPERMSRRARRKEPKASV